MAKEAIVTVAQDKPQRIGMLWFDDRGTLEERLARAGEYYAKKYGKLAVWATVNSNDYEDGEYGVEVEIGDAILPFHIWIGADDDCE